MDINEFMEDGLKILESQLRDLFYRFPELNPLYSPPLEDRSHVEKVDKPLEEEAFDSMSEDDHFAIFEWDDE